MAKGDRAAREQKSDGRQDQPNECRRRRAAASVGIRRSGHAATANIAAAEHQSTAVVRNTAAPRAYDSVTAWLVGRDMTVRSSSTESASALTLFTTCAERQLFSSASHSTNVFFAPTVQRRACSHS